MLGLKRRDDAGFTLIELLLVVVITGVVAVPFGGVVLSILRNTDDTTSRLSESHDVQIASAYFARDVSAVGVRDWSDSAGSYPLLQSVELDPTAAGGRYPCGAASLPSAVVRLAWDDYTTLPDAGTGASGVTSVMRVAYIVRTVNGEQQLHRVACAGSATPTSDVVLAHNVVSVAAACNVACTGSGSNVPRTVSLTVTVHGARSTASNLVTTLTGDRRQT